MSNDKREKERPRWAFKPSRIWIKTAFQVTESCESKIWSSSAMRSARRFWYSSASLCFKVWRCWAVREFLRQNFDFLVFRMRSYANTISFTWRELWPESKSDEVALTKFRQHRSYFLFPFPSSLFSLLLNNSTMSSNKTYHSSENPDVYQQNASFVSSFVQQPSRIWRVCFVELTSNLFLLHRCHRSTQQSSPKQSWRS